MILEKKVVSNKGSIPLYKNSSYAYSDCFNLDSFYEVKDDENIQVLYSLDLIEI